MQATSPSAARQPLRYSINVSLDGCVDHAGPFTPSRSTHQHAAEWLASNDAVLFGRVTYQLMQAWQPNDHGKFEDWIEPWMLPFAHTMDEAAKHVVSSTLGEHGGQGLGWNTTLLDGSNLEGAVQELKAKPGKGIGCGGVNVPLQLAQLGLIDEYEFVVHPVVAGRGPYLFAGLPHDIRLTEVAQTDLGNGVVARGFVPTGSGAEAC